MPRLTHPRAKALVINRTDNEFTGYTVTLGEEDTVTTHWLVADDDGTFRKRTIDVTSPAALAMSTAVFNLSKDEIS